jgi:spore coat polysaccharide biosynthesis protein SpsF (cytidylyltransferase family)
MANVRVRISVESGEDYDTTKVYYFSVGKTDSKLPSDVILDIIEKGMKEEMKDKFGVTVEGEE